MKRLILSIILLITIIGSIQLATHFIANNTSAYIDTKEKTELDSIMENITPPTPQQ